MGSAPNMIWRRPRHWVSVGLGLLLLALLFAPPGWDREWMLAGGVLLLLGVAAFGSLGHQEGRPLTPPRGMLIATGLWAMTLLLSAAAGTSTTALGAATHASWMILLWFGWWLGGDRRALLTLGKVAGLGAAVVGAICVLQMAGIDAWPRSDPFPDRIVGVFMNPNHLGSFCAFALPLATVAFLRQPSLAHWLLCGLTYAALLLAGSRGAWVGALGAICFLSLWILAGMGRDVRGQTIRRGAVLLLTWGVTTMVLSERTVLHSSEGELTVSDRMRQAGGVLKADERPHDATLQHRLLLWSAAAAMIQQDPVLGVGPGGFESAYQHALPALRGLPVYQRLSRTQQLDRPRFAHNEVLHVVAERGGLGVIALAGCVLLPLWIGLQSSLRWRRQLWSQGALGAAASGLIHGLVSYPLHIPTTGILVFLALGIMSRSPSPGADTLFAEIDSSS